MYALLILMLIGLMVFLIVISIDWLIHLSMTKDEKKDYGWGTFEDFKREFGKYTWDNEGDDDGMWDRKNNGKFFANIVLINGVGMLLRSPIAFFRAKRFVKGRIKHEENIDRNYDWSK